MNLYFENLDKSFNGNKVLENISGKISSGDKIGLIGINGIGKTTLAKILSGAESVEKGQVVIPLSLRILYLEQDPRFDQKTTVYDELYKTSLKNTSSQAPSHFIKKALNTVGLPEKIWKQPASSLSGGEKTKLLLARLVVSDFDFLLLDEPTNHLDIETCQRLEDYLSQLNKTMLIISHDRFFLDQIVHKIWELTPEGLKVFKGNYSDYKVQKEIEIKSRTREYEKQQGKIQNLEKAINERKNWFASAHQAAGQNDFYRSKAKKHARTIKAKKRELEKLKTNQIRKPKKRVPPAFDTISKTMVREQLPPTLVQIKNLIKHYGEKTIFKDASLQIRSGDKIALIGANGSGKSTLLKIINGIDRDYQGEVTISPSVRIGYLAQELDNLNGRNTIVEEILLTGAQVSEARLLLAGLLFRGDDVYKEISKLSMGEKCRVAFAKLISAGATLLLLDEPTNHLDIISREKIEEVLEEYQGSLLFVSHDRYLVKRTARRILKIENQRLKCYEGGYDYYLAKSQQEALQEQAGENYDQINDKIMKLEWELACISGQLSQTLEEEEKEKLNNKFIEIAKQLNKNKKIIEELGR